MIIIPRMPTIGMCGNEKTWAIRLQSWGRECATIAQREAALADELAEALNHMHGCADCAEGPWDACEEGRKALATLAKHTAARQMNKEARNE